MDRFKLISDLKPRGDQPEAISLLVSGILDGLKHQVLLGVTGSGKTYTMACVIEKLNRPTLVISHNKTLAAQLYGEFKSFFPYNAVEYFVSYYDYYQPEAYVPQTDTYIEKDASINDAIDKMRHSATRSLLERRDVIIVASVSCIYGLGEPDVYYDMSIKLREGDRISREEILERLVEIQYERKDYDFHRGTFRVRGDVVEVFPSHEENAALRIELSDETVETIWEFDPVRGKKRGRLRKVIIYPASHYVTPRNWLKIAIENIRKELYERVQELKRQNKVLEAERLKQRTLFDLELLEEMGYCPGIENYSRHLTGRRPGEPPPTLMDYIPKDTLIFIDESHVTIPQLQGMYRGDRSRKETLVEYGFRLPSALDNRPLTFEEFEERVTQVIYVSATPGPYELEKAAGRVVEQIIRPTGLTDPEIVVKEARNQVDDLLSEIRETVKKKERVLVTTLTKKMAEELTEYYSEMGVRVRYLHSDIDTLERVDIIRDLRMGKFDVLIGINLLREGLDIPEVSLVAILDADKEGFLRSETSLIQTCGRAARNINGKVIMYADFVTNSMKRAIEEMRRRRRIQEEYNRKHGITPQSIKKEIHDIMGSIYERDYYTVHLVKEEEEKYIRKGKIPELIMKLRREMLKAAKEMEFEKAAVLRDKIKRLEEFHLKYG